MAFKLTNSAATSNIWNASQLQGAGISQNAVVAGQVLTYNGTVWQGVSASPVQTVSVPSQSLDPNTTFSILQPTTYSTNYTLGSPTGTYNTKTIILNGNNNVNVLCVPGTINLTPETPSASLVFSGNQWIRYGVSNNTYNWFVSRQQGTKLVATGYTGASAQGNSVALSGDGNYLAVGGYTDASSVGATWLFSATGGTGWAQTQKLIGSGYVGTPEQGVSVALSSDNSTLAVGGPNDNGGVGAVWMFANGTGAFSQQGAKLVPNDAVGNANFSTVSLTSNGNILAVGGYSDNGGVGATWIFTRTGTGWSQSGSKIVASAVGNASQGTSVALSSDGSTLAIGGPNDNSGIGAVWIYSATGSTYAFQAKLTGTGYVGSNIQQGASVAMSSDGNTVAVGGISDNSNIGATWIFNRQGTTWAQQGVKLVGTNYSGQSQQGFSLCMSGDGNTLAIGGAYDNQALGATWIFTRTGVNWTQQGAKLVGSGYVGGAPPSPYDVYQSVSSAISTSGAKVVIGGSGDNGNIGAVWTFI